MLANYKEKYSCNILNIIFMLVKILSFNYKVKYHAVDNNADNCNADHDLDIFGNSLVKKMIHMCFHFGQKAIKLKIG